MTASPMSIRAGPFVDGIVDYSQHYDTGKSMVMIVHHPGEVTSNFHIITNMDKLFIYLFLISFLLVFTLFIITMDRSEIIFVQSILKIFLNLILPIFNQGIIFINKFFTLNITFFDIINI